MAIGYDGLLNAGKEFAESGPDNITEVDGERTNDEAEVDEDDGDDKAREDTLDAIVVDAEAGELRINDDKEEDDENDVGDVAGVLPDEVDGRVGFHTEGWNNRKTIYDVVDSINEFGDDAGGRTDNPSEGADLVFAGVRLVFCARVFWVVGVVFFVARLDIDIAAGGVIVWGNIDIASRSVSVRSNINARVIISCVFIVRLDIDAPSGCIIVGRDIDSWIVVFDGVNVRTGSIHESGSKNCAENQ